MLIMLMSKGNTNIRWSISLDYKKLKVLQV